MTRRCLPIFPRVREARLVKSHVIKEQCATFSAAPETECLRPTPEIGVPTAFLVAARGTPARFLVPDLA